MPTVLSTKVLNTSQKQHLFAAGIGLVEYEALIIKKLDSKFENHYFENTIFTSQNAVKYLNFKSVNVQNAFCVGDNTASLLKQHNIFLKAKAESALALANIIIEKYPKTTFDYFCSSQRRNELPDVLKFNKIQVHEHHLYESVSNYKLFHNQFDAVLCYSPMGVKTYYEKHKSRPLAICIGETTAQEAKKYTEKVIVASKTSIESVLIKTIKNFNQSCSS